MVFPDGSIYPATGYGPEDVILSADSEGSVADEPFDTAEWEFLQLTGQYGYHGAVMHPSETLRGSVVDHLVSMAQDDDYPQIFCCVTVGALGPADDDEPETMGWAIAHHVGPVGRSLVPPVITVTTITHAYAPPPDSVSERESGDYLFADPIDTRIETIAMDAVDMMEYGPAQWLADHMDDHGVDMPSDSPGLRVGMWWSAPTIIDDITGARTEVSVFPDGSGLTTAILAAACKLARTYGCAQY